MTLHRYCKIKKQVAADRISSENSGSQVKCRYARPKQLFSDSEENELITYLLLASKIFFALLPKEKKGWFMNWQLILARRFPITGKLVGQQVMIGFQGL
jgi:hypothetical protein